MKPLGKIFFAAGGLAVALLLWLIWREHERLSVARERLLAHDQRLLILRKESLQQQQALATFGPPAAAPAASLPSATSPATASVPKTTPQPAAPAPGRAASRPWLSRLFAESPNLHRLYLEAHRSELEFAHALTFERLGLNGEERATIVAILARDMERRTDIAATARGNHMSSNDDSLRTLEKQREQERDAALKQVLGERRASWSLQSRPMMPVVSTAAMHLHRTASPLTLAQADQLDVLMRQGLSARRVGDGFVPPTDADYAMLARDASRLLSPEQSEVVRLLIEQHAARRQLDQFQAAKRK